ncbi:MAG: hypothetical protein JO261_14290 [Alphaproteobacteria bacterium]|nr:hypothetical protein [Alphaproteobacteria bacterium]
MNLHSRISGAWALAAAALAFGAALSPAGASTHTVLHTFCTSSGCPDGSSPGSPLLKNAAKYYGTTTGGGAHGGGVIYRYDTNNSTYTDLYDFCVTGSCPNTPMGNLIRDSNGNLYGTAQFGGANSGGAVWELVKNGNGTWTFQTLYSFCATTSGSICTDGNKPQAGLTYAGQSGGSNYDGTSLLFGTTAGGGSTDNGAVFALQLSGGTWSEKVIHSFAGQSSDGRFPNSTMWMDSSNNLWGTTKLGGEDNKGIAFELVPGADLWNNAWTETVLYNFCYTNVTKCPDGEDPAGIVLDGSGNIYGETRFGGNGQGTTGEGVVFKLNNGNCSENGTSGFWCNTVLYNFCPNSGCQDGEFPTIGETILRDGSGNIYGTTLLGGTGGSSPYNGAIYKLTSGGSESVLYSFCQTGGTNCTDGALTANGSGLAMDGSGNIFGTNPSGGDATNQAGVVYEWTP